MDEINLKLTPYESDLLYLILTHVGGDPEGPRGAIDNIRLSLVRQNVSLTNEDIVVYDGKTKPSDVWHTSPSLYIDTKKEHDSYFEKNQ